MLATSNKDATQILEWLQSLKVGDKLDIFDKHESNKCWYIGTIIKIQSISDQLKYKISYDGWPSKWDEWVIIDDSVCMVKLDKLYNRASYHSTARVCKSERWMKCINCNKKLCAESCLQDIHNRDKTIVCEEIIIFNTLKQTQFNQINDKIIQLISSYSIGYIINCCKQKCDQEINIKCQYDLYQTPLIDCIYGKNSIDIDKNVNNVDQNKTVKLYGRYYKISCKTCSLHICPVTNEELFEWTDECKKCVVSICDDCGTSLCKHCMISQEKNDIHDALLVAVENNIEITLIFDVLCMITEFATGVIAKCCNKECENEIITDNRFLFQEMQQDINETDIYCYMVKEIKSFKPYEMVHVFDESYRVFCGRCSIEECECHNWYETETYCGDIVRCTECGDNGSKLKIVTCIQCDTYCCMECFDSDRKICRSCIRKLLLPNLGLLDDKIIDVITQYSIGLNVECKEQNASEININKKK